LKFKFLTGSLIIGLALFLYACNSDTYDNENVNVEPTESLAELDLTINGESYEFIIDNNSNGARLYNCVKDSLDNNMRVTISATTSGKVFRSIILLMTIPNDTTNVYQWDPFSMSLSFGGMEGVNFYHIKDADSGSYQVTKYADVGNRFEANFSGTLSTAPQDHASTQISINGRFSAKRLH
jgi:hypothetical protein